MLLKNENHTFLSVSSSIPYQDPSGTKRTDGEIPPTLGIRLKQFSPAKKHLRHQRSKRYLQIPGRKKIVEALSNLFQFFSMLIGACLLEGLVFYRYLLKLQQERHESVMTSYLLALRLRLPSVSAMLPQGPSGLPGVNEYDASFLGSW